MEDIALIMRKARETFPGIPIFLFGHSLGGNLALNFILRNHPDLAGVITTSPALCTASPTPLWKLALARIMYRIWPSCLFNSGVDPEDKTHDADVLQAIIDDPLGHSRISARLGLDMLNAGEWAIEHASEFNLPLLIMQGGADRVISVDANRQFAGRVPGDSTLKIWDGLFHELHSEPEHPEIFAYIVEWLNAHVQ
jgi:alpha-beta hydrolase superfamily lysophospholipase